jgi:hypothetical protein
MCLGVSCLALHWQVAIEKPRTLCLCRNSASLIFFVRACVSKALSAFRSPSWGLSTFTVGGVSSGTTGRFPGSVPGRTIRSNRRFSLCHLISQSWCTSFFACQSHWSIACPVHYSTHNLRLVPGVVIAGCALALLRQVVRRRILLLITLHAFLTFWAIPECSIRAWNRAMPPLSHRSSGGTYDSVSSCRAGVALKAPSTILSPW